MNPGTHLVKKHEAQSKKQPHSLKTDSVLQFTERKIYFFYCKAQQRLKNKCCLTTATRTATEITQTGYSTKKHL